MNHQHYILDENKKIKPVELLEWAQWLENNPDRVVGKTIIGEVKVSTVFLGLDHNFWDDGPPVLWETMIFGGKHDQYQDRCGGNYEQAEAMHMKAVAMVTVSEIEKRLKP
jgi:hypothetical protein